MGFLTSTVTISSLVTDIGSFVTGAISWITSFADAITGNEYLKLGCIAVPLVGIGVGLLSRLFRGAQA